MASSLAVWLELLGKAEVSVFIGWFQERSQCDAGHIWVVKKEVKQDAGEWVGRRAMRGLGRVAGTW